MDNTALFKLSYGLFLLTSKDNGKDNGCIINTAIQTASEPLRLSISVIKKNLTCDMILNTGIFNLSVLTKDTAFPFYRQFGMQSGRTADKFADKADFCKSENGILYYEKANAVFECKVTESHDLGSHILFTASVIDAKTLSKSESVTYAYYHSDIKPKPQAPARKGKAWVCKICGYVYEGEELPKDFTCPLCNHGVEDFEPLNSEDKKEILTNEGDNKMKKYICPVCGYVYEGENPPAECPVCHVPGSKFTVQEGDIKLAAEHEYGIYAKTVKNNDAVSAEDKAYIFEQLMANFKGECSEVGMYLCMARIAHREGYPEIGLYWEKAAYEEAEHAAKFAELLGEDLEPNMKATTKDNLKWRVDCEFGATQGKFDLALCAKKNGLDAIHDTVHEMARDEARHGKALKGFLDRYFK